MSHLRLVAPIATAREFSPAGPCLTVGDLIRETPKFWVVRDEWTDKERRIAKSQTRMHFEACARCTDHSSTVYPFGYND